MIDLLEEILTRLTLLDSQMKSPYSKYYCTSAAKKVEIATGLLREVAKEVKNAALS